MVASVGVVIVGAGISLRAAAGDRVVVARAGDRFIGSVNRGPGLHGCVLAADRIAGDRDGRIVAARGHDIRSPAGRVARCRIASSALGACAGLRGGVITADRDCRFHRGYIAISAHVADREAVIALAAGLRGDIILLVGDRVGIGAADRVAAGFVAVQRIVGHGVRIRTAVIGGAAGGLAAGVRTAVVGRVSAAIGIARLLGGVDSRYPSRTWCRACRGRPFR